MKFLWSLNLGINIHAADDYAFRMSCQSGHLEVVKFLWSLNLGINIHADNEHAFRLSCIEGHLEIVKFLITLYKQENNNKYLLVLNRYYNIMMLLKNE